MRSLLPVQSDPRSRPSCDKTLASRFFQRVDIVIVFAPDLWKLATPGSEHLLQRALDCRFITSGANIGIFIRKLTVETAGHNGAVMLVASNTALAGSCRVEELETAKGQY